jgi:hypothetical protein
MDLVQRAILLNVPELGVVVIPVGQCQESEPASPFIMLYAYRNLCCTYGTRLGCFGLSSYVDKEVLW